MSEDVTAQPVVEKTDVQPLAGTEVKPGAPDQGDTIDDALKAYDEKVSPKPTKPEPKTEPASSKPAAPDPAIAELHQRLFRQDMNDVIKDVRGDLPADVFDNDTVEAWLDAQARKDPRLQAAWRDRLANPQQFGRVKAQLGKEFAGFAKKLSRLPDANATEDREAVTAAVRGASTRAPEGKAPDFGRLSNVDFEKEKAKLFGT